MLITKRIGAFDLLNTFVQDEWDEVGEMVKYILSNHLEDKFDWIVNSEFPCGCEEDEFKDFCLKETNYIYHRLKNKDF